MHAPDPHPPFALRLAELVAARLCQDFGSPLSTLTAIMPQAAEAPARALLTDTVAELRARHHLFCALFGQADALEWPRFAALLAGAPAAHRVRFELGEVPPGDAPGRSTMRLLLAAMLLCAEALPRGGAAHLAFGAGGGFTFRPTGRDGSWPTSLLDLLATGDVEAALEAGPRRVLAPWVFSLARAEGRELALSLGESAELPALALSAPSGAAFTDSSAPAGQAAEAPNEP